MKLNYHIIYQYLLSCYDAYEEIIDVFSSVLHEKGIDISNEHFNVSLKKENLTDLLDSEGKQHVLIVASFLENFSFSQTVEYINLGRKEKIAREVLRNLNQEKKDSFKIQHLLNELNSIPLGKIHLSTTMTMGIRVSLISEFICDHLPFVSIAKNHINMRDSAEILNRSVISPVATGHVGGKAAGMILANRILRPTLGNRLRELDTHIEEVESYFIKSSITSEFVTLNKLEECHSLKYLEGENFKEEKTKLYSKFIKGVFSENALSRFREILIKTKDSPLILRSSSYLEDSVGFPFSGKYGAIIISNKGTMEERLEELTAGIKEVYFSLYSYQVIQYRKNNNLLDYNEKMSILIQKVIGNTCGKYFFPHFSIIGSSSNRFSHKKHPNRSPAIKIALGLRTETGRETENYSHWIRLSDSAAHHCPGTANENKKDSSRCCTDVFNVDTGKIETISCLDLFKILKKNNSSFPYRKFTSNRRKISSSGQNIKSAKSTCDFCAPIIAGLKSDGKFVSLMKQIFGKVENAYKMPVKMEFAYHNKKLYILQCRPKDYGA